MRSRISLWAGTAFGLLMLQISCAGVPPTITNALVAFGAELIGKASINYTDEYAHSVNQVLLAVAETATGQPFTQQQQYAFQQHNGRYDDQSKVYNDHTDDGQSGGYYGDQSGSYDDQHGSDSGQASEYRDDDPGEFAPQSGGYAGQSGDYGNQTGSYSQITPSLEVALLAHTIRSNEGVTLRPLADGAVLRDGGSNPAASDKIKLSFRANCNCYLYIIGIDATGWITRIRPEPFQYSEPVIANRSYLIPQGTEWWGLDSYEGVEHIYFVLSHDRRSDLEAALEHLPSERPRLSGGYQPIGESAIVSTRGLVKVSAPAPTEIPSQTGQLQQVTADSFTSRFHTADLVVTRWFRHE